MRGRQGGAHEVRKGGAEGGGREGMKAEKGRG